MNDRDRWQGNVEVVQEMLARVSAGDTDGYLAHLTDDAEYVAPYYPEMAPRRGRDEIAQMLGGLFSRFKTVSYTITDTFETIDPDLVICEARGDNQVLGSDRRYRNQYVMFVRFRDGQVAHWTEYSDPNVYHRAVDEV